MKRFLFLLLVFLQGCAAYAAAPGTMAFNSNQFDVTGNRVALKDGLVVTNLTLTGAGAGNLFELYNESNELKFWIDNNGFSYPGLWTNSGGIITGLSTGSGSAGYSLDTINAITGASTPIVRVMNGGTNVFSVNPGYVNILNNNGIYMENQNNANSFGYYFFGGVLLSSDNITITSLRGDLTSQSTTSYVLSTRTNHTSGNIFEVQNKGTNVFAVPWDGAAVAPSIITTNITVENNITVKGNAVLNVFTAQSGTVSNNLTVLGNYVGTIDPTQTGTTLKQTKSLKLQFPRLVDGTGCTYANTNDYTALTFMLPQFSGSAATNGNFCQFAFRVPTDLDTAVDLTASLTIRLAAADTSAQTYTVGVLSIANSAAAAGTAANYVTLTVGADASGASGDIESVSGVTLTSWKSNMTAGQWCLVQLQRDGSDSSTQASNLMELEIFYGSTQ